MAPIYGFAGQGAASRGRSVARRAHHPCPGTVRVVTEVPAAVARQAMHPFSTLPLPVGWRRIDAEGVVLVLHPLHMPQLVDATEALTRAALDGAIECARAAVRDFGRDSLAWLTGPDLAWLPAALVEQGLVNEDSSGMESVENAMALLTEPAGHGAPGIDVSLVDSLETFTAATDVELRAFAVPTDERRAALADVEERWNEYTAADVYRRWIASIDGTVVGTAVGVPGEAGMNLFGGSVLEEARGRGVYRALVQSRWEEAVRRGTPALTVQAGRTSGPILQRLGFRAISLIRLYVDHLK
jgi:GNAT superfamily N-acetyltransferase